MRHSLTGQSLTHKYMENKNPKLIGGVSQVRYSERRPTLASRRAAMRDWRESRRFLIMRSLAWYSDSLRRPKIRRSRVGGGRGLRRKEANFRSNRGRVAMRRARTWCLRTRRSRRGGWIPRRARSSCWCPAGTPSSRSQFDGGEGRRKMSGAPRC
jgi:hypothetical protein